MCLKGNAEKLYKLLFTKVFDAAALISELNTGNYTADDVNLAALGYVDACMDIPDYDEYDKHPLGETIPGIESSHLCEAVRILLDYGLDPNRVMDVGVSHNIMWTMQYVHNGYQTADAAALLLEHGGNPNLIIEDPADLMHLVYDLCLNITWFLGGDEDSRYIADAFMHYWMVFAGYGMKYDNGDELVECYDGFKPEDFRNHRQYYCGIIHTDDDRWVSFFDKETNREVARY